MGKRIKSFLLILVASVGLVFAEGDYYNQKYGGGQSGGGTTSGGTTGGGTTGSGTSEGGGSGEQSGPTTEAGPNAGDSQNEDGGYDNDNNHDQQVDSVLNAVDNGGNLGYIPDGALAETYYSDSASQEQKDQIRAELEKRGVDVSQYEDSYGANGELSEQAKEEVAEAEKKAKEAEDAAAEALRDLTQIENQIAALEKALKGVDLSKEAQEFQKDVEDYCHGTMDEKTFQEKKKAYTTKTDNDKKLAELKNEEAAAKEKVDQAFDAMKEAYQELGDVYTKYGITGDPVEIGTGRYIAEYTDFEAQDYLNKFLIKRNHCSNTSIESFGANWTCQLDSRIIRCSGDSYAEFIAAFSGAKDILNEIIAICTDYNEKYPIYPDSRIQEKEKRSSEVIGITEEAIKYYTTLEDKKKNNETLNQFIHYGRYKNCDTHHAVSDFIIYLDENGQEYYLHYDSAGYWKPFGKIASSQFKIVPMNDSFRVDYNNGTKKLYSKYGILQKETDRNGNETVYSSDSTGRINKIRLKTGETLTVNRNGDSCITSITGPVSGTASYSYSGGRLRAVTDNNGITVSYEYDSDGNITSINKSDGTKVVLQYSYDNYKKCKVCTSVRNENGVTETFSYDYKNNTVQHRTIGGYQERFTLNAAGLTTQYSDGRGNNVALSPDSLGIVRSITRNGIKMDYSYDSRYLPVKITFSDGGNQTVSYNSFGQIVEIKDRDGFSNRYTYDSKGNITAVYYCNTLISSATYYGNGLLKTLSEGGCQYSYEYNAYGSLIKKTCRDSSGKTKAEKWNYDSKNRPVLYTPSSGEKVTVTYSSSSPLCAVTVQYGNRKQTVKKFDNRGRVSEYTEKDLKTNKSFTLKYEYDGCGNTKKILLNNQVYMEYTYNNAGYITSYTVWNMPAATGNVAKQGTKQSYTYDSQGRIATKAVEVVNDNSSSNSGKLHPVAGSKTILHRYSYSASSSQTAVNVYTGDVLTHSYVYDVYGRLIKETAQDGFTRNIAYSKAGKISSIRNSNNQTVSYSYKTDGSCSVTVQNADGGNLLYTYNAMGLLVSVRTALNQVITYTYNSDGNVVEEKAPWSNKKYSYDELGRKIKTEVKNGFGEIQYSSIAVFNDNLNERKYYEGNILVSTQNLDCWNRVIKESSEKGTYTYDYDWFGNVVKLTDQNGNITEFEYTSDNNLAYKSTPDDSVIISEFLPTGQKTKTTLNGVQIFSANYDSFNRQIDFTDSKNNLTKLAYDALGLISSVGNYDTGTVTYNNQISEKKITVTNSAKQKRVYEIGNNGQIMSETDMLGKKTSFAYDKTGRIISVKYASGNTVSYSYDDSRNAISMSIGNGESYVVEQNAMNNITGIKSSDSDVSYEYDLSGRLTSMEDKQNHLSVKYSYDDKGRCTRKTSSAFDYVYSYTSTGLVSKVEDKKSGAWLTYVYDISDRIIKEEYSNGLVKTITYNSIGEKQSVVIKNKIGEIVFDQEIHYDSTNKIDQVISNGKLWTYSYDSVGRLKKVTTPYSEVQRESSYEEAVACGLGIQTDNPDGVLVTGKDSNNEILKQYSWFEEYEYTDTGSVGAVTNPFGKIVYEYDSLNRITQKHGSNTISAGIKYTWNKDDCLCGIKSELSNTEIEYNGQLRPAKIQESNLLTGDSKVLSYSYDALGRRTSESSNNLKTTFIYEGFSSKPVIVSQVKDNGVILMNETPVSLDTTSNNNYRWIEGSEYSPYSSTRGMENVKTMETDIQMALTDMRPVSILYMNGTPVIKNYIDGNTDSGVDSEFIAFDFRGNSVGYFDAEGDVLGLTEIDLWGNEATQKKNAAYSYSGLRLQTELLIFDLGSRDYIPSIKSFTTSDPARSGNNWFAFSSCDPLNYSDDGGLKKKSNTAIESAYAKSAIAEVGKFDLNEAKAKGESHGIKNIYDCADVSSNVDKLSRDATGKKSESHMQDKFDEHYKKGEFENSRWDVQSNNYYDDGHEKDTTRVGGAEDRTNPDIVEPGTTIVYRNNTGKGSWTGHTITILARDFDENGNIIGVAYIEGHTGGGRTETGYMRFDITWKKEDNLYSLFGWKGEFMGFYELEATGTEQNCGK